MSSVFSQDNRLMQLVDPAGDESLTITHLEGEEGLSQDFCFTLECLSQNTAIDTNTWLGKAVTVTINVAQSGKRVINGVVKSFTAGNTDYQGTRRYTLQLVSWFSALQLNQNYRIFQNLTILQIFQTVCRERGFTDFDLNQLGYTYQPVEYLVQYEETDQQFLQRILAQEKIFYNFVHNNDKHVLTLYDASSSYTAKNSTYILTPEYSEPHLLSWQQNNVEGVKQYQATSNIADLLSNTLFNVKNHQGKNVGTYYATQIKHSAADLTHRVDNTAASAQAYMNTLVLQSQQDKFVPQQLPVPQMKGPESAIVVGPQSKTIYTDAAGRAKVQFFWDRLGKKNENSSCWLPVAQIQAGDGFGSQYIPRVGDEVIVDFVDGDINQPAIIGSVYHQNNQPIFSATSSTNVVSGLKTKLLDGASAGHELSMNDTPGAEVLTLKSAGDYTVSVMNNLIQSTQSDETITLNQDVLYAIVNGACNVSANSLQINVGGSQVCMDSSGVTFKPAGKVQLLAKGVPAQFPIARVGDLHHCPKMLPCMVPHDTGPIVKGSQVVMANNLAVARVNDPIACNGENAKVKNGADSILIDNQPAAHVNGDSDHGGKIIKSTSNVMVGPRQAVQPVTAQITPEQQILKGDDVADVIYDVGTNEFYALTTDQLKDLLSTADPLMTALVKLHHAVNEKVDANNSRALDTHQKAIVAAKAAVNQHMQSMVNSPEDIKITEIIHFIGKDPTRKNSAGKYPWINSNHTYIASQKMKPHWRSYRIDKDFQKNSRIEKIKQFHQKMKDSTTGNISRKKVLQAAAKAMNKPTATVNIASFDASTAYKTFAKKIGNEHFDASVQAKLFRAAAGGAVNSDFEPKAGKFSFSADGSASANLAQAQAEISSYIPSRYGFPIKVYLPKNANGNDLREIDLGSLRVHLTAMVAGFVGASVAAAANLNLAIHPDERNLTNQKLQMVGNNKPDPTIQYKSSVEKADVDKNGLKTNVNAFAGAKASGHVSSNISWQNPDTVAITIPKLK